MWKICGQDFRYRLYKYKLFIYLFLFFNFSDVGCVQISPDSQKGFESETRYAPIVRFEIVENANQISGPAMAKIKYENNVSYLHQS